MAPGAQSWSEVHASCDSERPGICALESAEASVPLTLEAVTARTGDGMSDVEGRVTVLADGRRPAPLYAD